MATLYFIYKLYPIYIKSNHLSSIFFSNLFDETILPQTRTWVSVPIRQGGTAIPKPEEMAHLNYRPLHASVII